MNALARILAGLFVVIGTLAVLPFLILAIVLNWFIKDIEHGTTKSLDLPPHHRPHLER